MRRNANKCVNVLKECVKPGNGIAVAANPVDPRMAVPVETAVANPAVTMAKHPKVAPVVTTANQADPRMAARILNMAIPLDHRTVAPAAIMESPPMASPIIIQGVTMDQKTVIPRVVGMTNTAVTVQDIHGVPP